MIRTWQPKSYEEELARVQRYYEKSYNVDTAPLTATQTGMVRVDIGPGTASQILCSTQYKTVKRNTGTIVLADSAGGSGVIDYSNVGSGRTGSVNANGMFGLQVFSDSSTVNKTGLFFHFTVAAEL